MRERNDGGPAFPEVRKVKDADFPGEHSQVWQQGMTLRDWFAGQALAGQLASLTSAEVVAAIQANVPDPEAWAAESAYRFADAMLAEREKR